MMPSPAWRSVPSGRGLSYQRTSWPCCCQRIHKSRALEPISITRMRILYSHFATAIVVVTTWETHMKLVLAALLVSQFLFADFLILKALNQPEHHAWQDAPVAHGPWEMYQK